MLLSRPRALALFLAVLLIACEHRSFDPVVEGISAGRTRTSGSGCVSYSVPTSPYTRTDFKGEQFSQEYNIGLSENKVLFYLPSNQGTPAQGKFPLTIILHRRTYNYDLYRKLQERLAANGIASASLQYSVTHAENDFDEFYFIEKFKNFLGQIYGNFPNADCPLQGKVTNNISIIGHSMGGGLAVYAANTVAKEKLYGLSVRSVVTLAPNPQIEKNWFLTPQTTSKLLVMFGSNDPDTGVNACMNSGFGLYDLSGYSKNEYETNGYAGNAFEKSMVFLKDVNHVDFTDNGIQTYQETIKSYVVSFLRWSLLDDQAYKVYFKYQEPVDYNYETIVNLQYSESGSKKVLDNFEGNAIVNTSGGMNSYQNVTYKKGISHALISDSPHFTNVLTLQWDKKNATVPKVIFTIGSGDKTPLILKNKTAEAGNLKNYGFFSFRMGQVYNPIINKNHLDFTVRITYQRNGSVKSQAKKVSEFGDIPFPFAHQQESKTKSAMGTVMVPLCAFGEIDFQTDAIQSIAFEFDAAGFEKGHIQLDNLEFIP